MKLIKDSCLRCSKWMACREPLKSPKHKCVEFSRLKEIDSLLELDELELVPRGETEDAVNTPVKKKKKAGPVETAMGLDNTSLALVDTAPDLDKDNFVWEAMQKAYDPLTNTVRDLKIDDSPMKRAKNYYHFCTQIAGTAIKAPFSRQLWIATHLFGEYCPRCTHKNFKDINRVPVDMDSKDLVDNITLLEDGMCPKCGVSKAQLIISKELMDYNQLVMVAGQRAGKSALTSTMAAYHLHLMLKAPRLSTICRGIQDFTPLTGTFVALSLTRSVKLLWNPFDQIVEASSWFCVAEGSEITLSNNTTVAIEEVKAGDTVKTFEGENNVLRVFNNGVKDTLTLTLENGSTLAATPEHSVQCLAPDGESLFWKRMDELTPEDLLVVD